MSASGIGKSSYNNRSSFVWEISEKQFPAERNNNIAKLKFLLRYAILAPSSHNTQPWTFRTSDDKTIHLYADRTRALPVVDPDDRELTISCGSALFNLQVAISYFGYTFESSLLPEGESNHDLLATVRVKDIDKEPMKTKDEELRRLFTSITSRRTNRFRFDDKKIPENILSNLQSIEQKHENIWFHIEKEMEGKEQLANLITEGDLIQMSDKKFMRELASWVHSNRSQLGDGIPGYAFGFGDTMSLVGPFVIRTFDFGKGQTAKDKELAVGSPILLVIGTNSDNMLDWLNAGLALSNMLLYLKSENIWSSYLNQPIEVPELRERLVSLIPRPHDETNPQLLLRIGYSQKKSVSNAQKNYRTSHE